VKTVDRLDEGGSLVDRAVRRVRDHISERDLKVGDTLPGEGHFATELGVSRAVMREAFGALAALRLIDVANGRRARVGAIDGSVMGTSIGHAVATAQVSVAEVWDVRRTLELRTAELAARGRSDADAVAIRSAARAMATATDIADVTRHDIVFHQAIARASGNALFFQIVRSFEPMMTLAVPVAWETRQSADARAIVLQRHEDIARAIADRDATAAGALMDAHFDQSIGAVL
jgi:DNA-binding FadR family transcriptional regulator